MEALPALISAAGTTAQAAAALGDFAARMARRCAVSVEVLCGEAGAAGDALARVVLDGDGRRLLSEADKALCGAAELERLCADQLTAWACVLEEAAAGTLADLHIDAIEALLSAVSSHVPPASFVERRFIDVDPSIPRFGRIRAAVGHGALSGTLCEGFVRGDVDAAFAHNALDVRVCDEHGDPIRGLEDADVTVRCGSEGGGTVDSVDVGVDGAIRIRVVVGQGDLRTELALLISVFGVAAGASPLRVKVLPACMLSCLHRHHIDTLCTVRCRFVQEAVMGDSTTLAVVEPGIRMAFTSALASEWLCGRSVGHILYRGSVDGMNARAFHTRCDHRGPTLTLIRADVGDVKYVFGGYTSSLFSVVGPHGSVQRFPLKGGSGNKYNAIMNLPYYGPAFGYGPSLVVAGNPTLIRSATAEFDGYSCNCLGGDSCTYEDTCGKGQATFTGAANFVPLEVEVYAVV